MKIIVKVEKLIEQCNYWIDNDITAIELEIINDGEKKSLEITGLEAGGMGMIASEFDPIEEMTQEEIENIP